MKRLWIFVGLHVAGIAAVICVVTGVARTQTVAPLTAPAAQPVQPQQPAREPPYIAPPVSAAPPIASRCEAASLAYLVGKPRTEIPVPVNPNTRRVSCTTCPVTQDYNPGRTDILFDAASGLITEVKCG
ncbi:MAG TPA: hypothetical protein VHZ26_20340 [Caulobacteraceae bacterium]|jgi:hypothetical protein|nr:hypothetical protein [Caulobacteraceae bacterium]